MSRSRSSPRSGGRRRSDPGTHSERPDGLSLAHATGRSGGRAAERAQAEPIAALAAVLAVCVGIALYAGAAAETTPAPERSDAEAVLERVSDAHVHDGVVRPLEEPDLDAVAPPGHEVRIVLEVDRRTITVGPRAPPDADRVSRPVTVQVDRGVQRPGRLTVEVWS